ncbi:hypothetical protein [Algiphilus sp.]|uniref:hypothetical protein n=1 Tax=Algiphilus sp. TaxID=1872431 RepID=UPI0025C4A14E|nr:hypothetical protein [Algiphilus sp.]MCK5772008.1 hypothetical protein [Algiphilus sp.]
MRNSLAIILVLQLSACASTPPAPEREPVSIGELIEIPAPPRAALETVDGSERACYALPEAERLADTLEAAFALAEQAEHVRDAAIALDAEASEQAAAVTACRQAAAERAADDAAEIWVWRLVSGVLGMALLGVAL